MINVFYYYYYLFYTKVLPDSQPHLTVLFTLSLSESFVVNTFLNSIFVVVYCDIVSKWFMLAVFLLIFLINSLYFSSSRISSLVGEKPKIKSNILSIVITVLFFIASFSLMILGPLYTRGFLEINCGK